MEEMCVSWMIKPPTAAVPSAICHKPQPTGYVVQLSGVSNRDFMKALNKAVVALLRVFHLLSYLNMIPFQLRSLPKWPDAVFVSMVVAPLGGLCVVVM